MEFRPAKGCVLVDMEFNKVDFVPSAERQYERMGKVLAIAPELDVDIAVGDVICFDEYGYRRFTLDDKDYCVVDLTNGALWAIIKGYEPRTEGEPVQT